MTFFRIHQLPPPSPPSLQALSRGISGSLSLRVRRGRLQSDTSPECTSITLSLCKNGAIDITSKKTTTKTATNPTTTNSTTRATSAVIAPSAAAATASKGSSADHTYTTRGRGWKERVGRGGGGRCWEERGEQGGKKKYKKTKESSLP